MLSEYPGDKDDFECKLKIGSFDFYPCEFNYFYDLTERGELRPYRQYLGAEQEYHNFSIPDCGTPNETASVARLLNEIITRSQRNHQSIIHGHEKPTFTVGVALGVQVPSLLVTMPTG